MIEEMELQKHKIKIKFLIFFIQSTMKIIQQFNSVVTVSSLGENNFITGSELCITSVEAR